MTYLRIKKAELWNRGTCILNTVEDQQKNTKKKSPPSQFAENNPWQENMEEINGET